MKKLIALLLAVLMVFSLTACGGNSDAASEDAVDFKIAIITGTTSQGEDEVIGATTLVEKYGADRILYSTYPDNFSEEMDTVISTIAQYADDPLVKAVIVSQAVPGTAEAFKQIKEKRPEVLCLAGTCQEDPAVISAAADICMDNNPRARGYLMIKTAHDLGCDTFVHISFPRHMAMESMQVRHAIMVQACEDFGMKFVDETAPDPTSTDTGGMDGAIAYMLENVPLWIEKYGQNAAFFCTNDGETKPLLKCLLANGGYFIESDLPSPIMGYPDALALEVEVNNGDWASVLTAVENAVCEKGGAGKFGTWKVSLGYTLTFGLGEYAWKYCSGEFDSIDADDVKKVFSEDLGAEYNFSKYINATDGTSIDNMIVVYQDTYIMGNPGYLAGNLEVEIPDWCYTIGVEG